MLAVEPPHVLEDDVLLKVCEQVVTGHGSAAEKVLGHPAVVLLKVVRRGLVAEDVNEE